MNNKIFDEIDWSKYDDDYRGGNRLTSNPKIPGQSNKQICFSREAYAQEMFSIFTADSYKVVKKDLAKGDCVTVTDIYNISGEKIMIELLGGLGVEIDLGREKRFIQLFGFETVDKFVEALHEDKFKKKFVSYGIYAYVIESSPAVKISLWQGHIKKTKEEFMKEIESPSKAYVAKVLEANKGGFFVEVQGVDAFMPGSLAAPNKILDFRSYVGKEVIVMVEDFLTDINSFIVSHKKYVEHVLPKKLSELDLDSKFTGNITGTSKYGIFIEFGEIFTGLLHNSKMKEQTLIDFKQGKFSAGMPIEFYINEITKDNRIILTEESPEEKKDKFNKFVEANKDTVLDSNVAAIMNFGVIVNVGDLSGLIPNKEFKRKKMPVRNLVCGDPLKVKLAEFKDDKIVFNLYDE
jgi:predicted RNA-binding protein with RPS1 domain